jgi:hypothetical protein
MIFKLKDTNGIIRDIPEECLIEYNDDGLPIMIFGVGLKEVMLLRKLYYKLGGTFMITPDSIKDIEIRRGD